MVFPGYGWNTPQAKEWGVQGIPNSYLISPNGVVVAADLAPEELSTIMGKLRTLGADNFAVMSVDASHKLSGQKIELSTTFNNPKGAETKYKLELHFEIAQKGENGTVTGYETKTESAEGALPTADGWEVSQSFSYDIPANCAYMYYTFSTWNPQLEMWNSVANYAFLPKEQ